jgi:Lipopolysaccharide kinase (Kdo/WaaP) family
VAPAAANFPLGRGFLADPGPNFPRFGLGRRLLYIRRDLASRVPEIFAQIERLGVTAEPGAGNRGSGFILKLDGGFDLFARANRRGGLVRFFLRDLYFGVDPRPVRELAVAAEAYRRGIAVAEPLGAVVEWAAPGVYRGVFLTRALSGMTLWDLLRTDDDATVCAHVIGQARSAIDTMHQLGLWHADLNLQNLFVTKAGESFAVVILDLDKAKLFRGPVAAGMRERSFARLARSVRKLDPDGRFLDASALAALTGT